MRKKTWDAFLVVPMTSAGVVVNGKTFVPLSDQLMRLQLIWELGPRRAVRVAAIDITDAQRASCLNELGDPVDRPVDIGAETVEVVESDLLSDFKRLGVPARPRGFIWCAQQPLNTTWESFFGRVISQQNVTSPDPRDDADIIRILLEDVQFSDD